MLDLTGSGEIRVLLVEDDDADARLFAESAVGGIAHPVHVVARADRLSDACAHLSTTGIDLVVLDLDLPDSRGLETFRRVRQTAPGVPVVVLTGQDDDSVALAATEEGAQDYLVKGRLPHLPVQRMLRSAVERDRLQQELRASEARFRMLVESAHDVVSRTILSPELQLEYVSPSIEDITGRRADEFLAEPSLWSRLVHVGDRDEWTDLEQLGSGVADRVLYRLRRGDGTWAWLEDRRVPVLEGGRLVAYQSITRDVSAMEEAKRAARAAFAREEAAVQRLHVIDEMKTAFLTAVSHEVRTPLTVIRGFAHTLGAHDAALPADGRRHMLERLGVAAERLQQLMDDLLDVEQISRGLVALHREPSDVGALIDGVVAGMNVRDHPVSVVCEPGLVAWLDEMKLRRMVESLLHNAVRHTPAGTRIYVVAEHQENDVVLIVGDEGPGVDPDLAVRLFQTFEQGEEARNSPSPGAGIGLALVDKLAELHGGSVTYLPTPEGGATFIVRLPSDAEAQPRDRELSPSGAGDVAEATDAETVIADALREFVHAPSVERLSRILIAAAERLGAKAVIDQLDGIDVLPLDLSLGTSDPVVATAPRGTVARDLLEARLPRLVEDAHQAAARLRTRGSDAAGNGIPLGFEEPRVLRDLLGRVDVGDALLDLRFVPIGPDHDSQRLEVAQIVRANIRAVDRAFVLTLQRFLVVLPEADADVLQVVMDRLLAATADHLSVVELDVAGEIVDHDGGAAAFRRFQGHRVG